MKRLRHVGYCVEHGEFMNGEPVDEIAEPAFGRCLDDGGRCRPAALYYREPVDDKVRANRARRAAARAGRELHKSRSHRPAWRLDGSRWLTLDELELELGVA